MSLSMYDASIPVFVRTLRNLDKVLAKGEAHARDKGVEPDALLQSRLIFDMLPLVRQVQIATDMATRGASRLTGQEPRSVEDNETTFEQLRARIAKTLAFVETCKAAQIEGSESRPISLTMGGKTYGFTGLDYLNNMVFPNFYFHVTTAYNILRHNGVELGKADFVGQI